MSDRQSFNSYFSENPAKTSEFTFTNFFIWRDCDRSQLTSINGNICVAARPENEPPYFFEPLGSARIKETISACLSHIPRFSRVSEEFAAKYFEDRKTFRVELDRDNCDYLYIRDDLVNLKGKKYDGKRNKIRRFLKGQIPIYKVLSKDDVPDCIKLLNKWKKAKGTGVCFDEPVIEALNNFSDLDLKGAVIRVNGKVEAFTIGEKLNPETAVIYIEVANPDIDGLSQYVNQQFCINQWAGVKYINREQDLGDAGLRKAKLSYHPFKLLNKYNVTLI